MHPVDTTKRGRCASCAFELGTGTKMQPGRFRLSSLLILLATFPLKNSTADTSPFLNRMMVRE